MIAVYKGNAEKPGTFRLLLICDQCQVRVQADVPLHNIRDQGDMATEPYLERARVALAQTCPHMQEDLERQEKDASLSPQETWIASRQMAGTLFSFPIPKGSCGTTSCR